ncbi:MAG: hypothetical protein ACXAE3_10105 [Candidatus Kariarchaeaceae archaeon]|jgi:hypothetical protein
MAKRSPLFQDGAESNPIDHSQKQARSVSYLFVWSLIWVFALFSGYAIYNAWGDAPWFGISTVNPSVFRFLGDYSLVMIVIMIAVAFSGATEIWSTPGVYFDPEPIESTFKMNQLVTRYINFVGPLLGLPLALGFYITDWVVV